MPLRWLFPVLVGILSVATLAGCGGGYHGRPYDRPTYGGQPVYNGQVQTLTCESEDGRSRSCRAGMRIGRVEIDKRLSNAPCQLGRTWGYEGSRVWVDQGCRARFRVYPAGAWGGGGSGGGGSSILRCESENDRRRRCDAGFRIERAVVERQLSNARCDKGHSWGSDGRGIWVEHGCRADFRLYRR